MDDRAAMTTWAMSSAHAGRRRFAPLVTLPMCIFRELVVMIGTALLIFTVMMMSVPLYHMFLRDGGSIELFLPVLPFLVPIVSPMVLPFSIVTGVLVTYGRLVGDREYLAAQAGGVHPLWLAVPAGLMAVIAVFLVVFLNEFALEASANRAAVMIANDQANIIKHQLQRPGSVNYERGADIISLCRLPTDHAEGVDRAGLIIVEFNRGDAGYRDAATPAGSPWHPRYPWPKARDVARHHVVGDAYRDAGTEQLIINITAEDVVHYSFGDRPVMDAGEVTFRQSDLPMPLNPNQRKAIRAEDREYFAMTRLNESRRRLTERIARREAFLREENEAYAAAAARAEAGGATLEQPPPPTLENDPNLREWRRSRNRLAATLHSKIALAFSCFCFAFLGVPMGLSTRRSGGTVTNFVLGVLISAGYALAMKLFEDEVAGGRLGWATIWLPNLTLLAAAFLFVRRARRMAL